MLYHLAEHAGGELGHAHAPGILLETSRPVMGWSVEASDWEVGDEIGAFIRQPFGRIVIHQWEREGMEDSR